jgi:hypothetical protein
MTAEPHFDETSGGISPVHGRPLPHHLAAGIRIQSKQVNRELRRALSRACMPLTRKCDKTNLSKNFSVETGLPNVELC